MSILFTLTLFIFISLSTSVMPAQCLPVLIWGPITILDLLKKLDPAQMLPLKGFINMVLVLTALVEIWVGIIRWTSG